MEQTQLKWKRYCPGWYTCQIDGINVMKAKGRQRWYVKLPGYWGISEDCATMAEAKERAANWAKLKGLI